MVEESEKMSDEAPVNVLLVDDRPDNLLVMETILEDLGQNLICATSAREALRFLLVEDVALILLDVQMPGLNGFELAELIRERERTQHTPIIFVSATSVDEQYVFKGYALGAVDYLTKPFTPEILKSKVLFFTKLFRQNREIKRQARLLEQANLSLDSANLDLEARVQERTTELETANARLADELSTRKESEARLATEHSITRTLAYATTLKDAGPSILHAFCEHMGAELSALWLLDRGGSELKCASIDISQTTQALYRLREASLSQTFARGTGLPGYVWEMNAPTSLTDDYQGQKFPRAKFAKAAGLTYAIGFPIKIADEFYGVIEFFTRRPILNDANLMNMLEAIGSEIGQFVQRKRVEAEREGLLVREKTLRQQAERASRLKDEFLATVSHELRTPLNSILGWGQILNTGRLTDEEQRAALDTIYRNARSQSQLIDDLLDTSRLITGNLHLNLSPTPVVPTIEAAIDVVRPGAAAKSITIETAFTSDVESITCDTQRLQQMVWNLLTNAVKFTPEGGTIEVGFERNANSVSIVVSDTGHGISAEFLPLVFDRFRQADSSSTRAHHGLGLGLAIVRHLAELHGGRVTVASEGPGKGATFKITLPITLAVVSEGKAVPKTGNGHHTLKPVSRQLDGLRVSIVDDDMDACNLLRFTLEMSGAEVKTSSSVADAIKSLKEWRPDILLTDINMPGEDGYSLIRRVRSLPPEQGANIPAIALTAMAREEDSENALSAGFQLHLPKPVDLDEMTLAILELSRRSQTDAG
ncbi:MAG TPA: response regulator [Pyrinomonadaceae bacterium]|nr:response regulator [Pyrinomonadaceae bacterium]